MKIELNAIRSFLQTIIKAAELEYYRIKTLSDAGKYWHYDDEANAYFTHAMWEEIAVHAALGELNALVEWELCNLASKPFFEKKDTSKEKPLRMVNDLKMNEIVELIENHYKITFNDLKDYKRINLIRSKVNSFKHRKGFKHPRKDAYNTIGEKYEVSRKEVFHDIDSVESFFKELWSKTSQEHMRNKSLK